MTDPDPKISMPIRVGCASCQLSLKVADALTGKAIKCPKCAAVLRLPGSGGPAAAPAVKTPPPQGRRTEPDSEPAEEFEEVEDEAAEKLEEVEDEAADEPREIGDEEGPRRRGFPRRGTGRNLSIEEDDLPAHLRDQIAEELFSGERLVWAGPPVKQLMLIRGLKWTGFGTFFLALIGLILADVLFPTAFGHKTDLGGSTLVMIVGGIFFIVLVCVLLSPFWALYRAGRTSYALTNRRAIVWACEWHGGVKITSYAPADLARMQRADSWVYGRGAGDLIFRTHTVVRVSIRGVSSRTYHYGFMAIDNVRAVEKLVRETLLDRPVGD